MRAGLICILFLLSVQCSYSVHFAHLNSNPWGQIDSTGTFIPINGGLPIITDFHVSGQIHWLSASSFYRVLRVTLPAKEYIRKKKSIIAYLYPIDSMGNILPGASKISVALTQVQTTDSTISYQSLYPNDSGKYTGKVVLGTTNMALQGFSNPYSEIVYCPVHGTIRFSIPGTQFAKQRTLDQYKQKE